MTKGAIPPHIADPHAMSSQCRGRDVTLRTPQPGDIGWVVHRHGALYWSEYRWDQTFEALVAQVAAEFVTKFKPGRERCWIAETNGRIVGSTFVVEASAEAAKLRLVYVEPEVRGSGLSRLMLNEALAFAHRAGYRSMKLWTNRNLVAARGLYASAGFRLVLEEPYRGFGHDLVGETWERELSEVV